MTVLMEEISQKEASCLDVRYGDIVVVDLGIYECDSRIGGIRPCLVIQNDIGNKYSHTVIVAPLTTKIAKKLYPTHIHLQANKFGLERDSIIMMEQITTVHKKQMKMVVSKLDDETMDYAMEILNVSCGKFGRRR